MTKPMHNDDEGIVKTLHPFEGLPNGEERFAKAQPEVCNLATGRLSGFTFDRLYRCLSAFEITLRRHVSTEATPASIHVSCL
jgi:hypothetical protein